MRHFPTPSRKRQGYALIELIITLGIAAIIAVSVWQVYGERQMITRGTTTSLAVESLIFNADTAYASQIGFATISGASSTPINMPRLADAIDNDLPRGVDRAGATFINPFGGTWALGAAQTNPSGPMDLLTITITQVPRGECQVVLGNVAPFVYDTRVNGTLVHLQPLTPADAPLRNSVSLTQGMPLCEAQNTMVFRHLKRLELPDLRRMYPYGREGLTDEERGLSPSWRYQESFLEHYNRLEAAASARETAQSAMD